MNKVTKLLNKLVAFLLIEEKSNPPKPKIKPCPQNPQDNYGTLKFILTDDSVKLFFNDIDEYLLYLENTKDFIQDDSNKQVIIANHKKYNPKEDMFESKKIDMRNFPPPPDSRRVRDIKQMLTLIDSLSEDLQKAQWKVISECAEKYSRLTPFEESNPINKTN